MTWPLALLVSVRIQSPTSAFPSALPQSELLICDVGVTDGQDGPGSFPALCRVLDCDFAVSSWKEGGGHAEQK